MIYSKYTYTYIHTYLSIYLSIYLSLSLSIYIYIYIHIHISEMAASGCCGLQRTCMGIHYRGDAVGGGAVDWGSII